MDTGKLFDEKFSVPGNNVESMGVDNLHHRLYVNIRDKQEVGVFDLNTKQLITTWSTSTLKANTALVVDAKDQRVFVAGRKPGIFYVFDQDGRVVSEKPCTDVNDGMTTRFLGASTSAELRGLACFTRTRRTVTPRSFGCRPTVQRPHSCIRP